MENTENTKSRDVEQENFLEATAEHQVKHNHLLVIAVDHYLDQDIPNLSNCINDVEDLLEVLTQDYFFNKENIRFLRSRNREEESNVWQLLALAEEECKEKGYGQVAEATHENIIAALKDLAKNTTSEDNVIICYSGHGIYDEDFNEGYWIPSDGKLKNNSTYIENATIRMALSAIDSHHTVLISDSCYSGTLFSSGKQRALDVPRIYNHSSRWGLTAGRRNQTVSDGDLGDNSPFAKELIKILKRKQEIWVGDLCKEILTELEKHSEGQTPMGEPFTNMPGHDGGQFVFLPRMAEEIDHWRIAWRENTRKAYFAFLARYPSGDYENVALEALETFSTTSVPAFSDAALTTFDFFSSALPGHAKVYLINYLKGKTTNVLSNLALQMYQYLLQESPNIARSELKSFILGRGSNRLQKIEEQYAGLLKTSPEAANQYVLEAFQPDCGNPYRGLSPFKLKQNELFFGRRPVVQELLDKVTAGNLVLISAPAYSGKTSLLKAGVFPQLSALGYRFEVLSPENNLQSAFDKLEVAFDPTEKVVVLIDQYEELFADGIAEQAQTAFENKLIGLCGQVEDTSWKIILSVRSNFEWNLNASSLGVYLREKDKEASYLYRLPPLGIEELREIILGPAWTAGCDFEDGLVDLIIEEVENVPDVLPILSFALHEFYKIAQPKRLFTYEDYYLELDRIYGAVNRFAGSFYDRLSPDRQQPAMEMIFLRMVQPNEGHFSGRRVFYFYAKDTPLLTKTPVELKYLEEADNETIRELIELLESNNLVKKGIDARGRHYIEPVYDMLINNWQQCREWIGKFTLDQLHLQRELWQAVLDSKIHRPANNSFLPTKDWYLPQPETSPYWASHPKLGAVLTHIMRSVTMPTQPASPLGAGLQEIEGKLSGDALRHFQTLIREWKENKTPPELDAFIITGVSGELLGLLLRFGSHWLNAEEAAFIRRSWEIRSRSAAGKFRQRDEAEVREKEIVRLRQESVLRTQAFKSKYQEQQLRFIQEGFRPDLHLILVSIDDDQGQEVKTRSRVQDAKSIAEALEKQQGKLYRQVNTHLLVNAEATKANILEQVEAVKQKAGTFDFVIVCLAGKGFEYELDSIEQGIDGKDGAFMPYDFDERVQDKTTNKNKTALSGQEFCNRLLEFSAKVVLILDVPFGGSFLSPLFDANRLDNRHRLTHNVFGLSGYGPGEKVDESAEGSVFFEALTQSFSNEAADLDNNGVHYLDEILIYTSKAVRKQLSNQNVYAVVPVIMPNIPLIQRMDTFALPEKEIAFNGHIEENQVIAGIMLQTVESEVDKWKSRRFAKVYQLMMRQEYDQVIQRLSDKLIASRRRKNTYAAESEEWLLLLAYIGAKKTREESFRKLFDQLLDPQGGHHYHWEAKALNMLYDFRPLDPVNEGRTTNS